MGKHITLFFSGLFAGCAMSASDPQLIWNAAVFAGFLYFISWALSDD